MVFFGLIRIQARISMCSSCALISLEEKTHGCRLEFSSDLCVSVNFPAAQSYQGKWHLREDKIFPQETTVYVFNITHFFYLPGIHVRKHRVLVGATHFFLKPVFLLFLPWFQWGETPFDKDLFWLWVPLTSAGETELFTHLQWPWGKGN